MLYPLSLLYFALHKIKQHFNSRNQFRAACKIISIGNITAGGSGKTPLTIAIAKAMTERGTKLAISHRGFKGKYEHSMKIVLGSILDEDALSLGDEAYMISNALPQTPVAVGKDRKLAIISLLKRYPDLDLIILDDSLQNRKVFHDLDIVVFSEDYGIGNGFLLPAGYLREPVSSINKEQIVVISSKGYANNPEFEQSLKKQGIKPLHSRVRVKGLFTASGKELDPVELDKPILISGIGNPQSFEETARTIGIDFLKHYRYPDHYNFVDVSAILDDIKANPQQQFICTHKDLDKLLHKDELNDRLSYIEIEADTVENGLIELILERLALDTRTE